MKRSASGFTLIEIIVTLGIFILLGGIVLVNIAGRNTQTNILSAQEQIGATLREAQADSVQQKNGDSWGVHFENSTSVAPFYALFYTSYSTSTVVGGNTPLPTSVSYNTSTLASGATLNVVFSQVSGATTSTVIGLYMPQQSYSSVITITSSGLVSY